VVSLLGINAEASSPRVWGAFGTEKRLGSLDPGMNAGACACAVVKQRERQQSGQSRKWQRHSAYEVFAALIRFLLQGSNDDTHRHSARSEA